MNYNSFMEKIKQSKIQGSFYSGNFEELKNQINSFKIQNKFEYEYKTRCAVVPHAGLIYSGDLAYQGINQIDKSIKNLFIFAPAHRVPFSGISLTDYDFFETPFGKIEINKNFNDELIKNFNAKFNNEAYEFEHSIEIELPIIQSIFDNIKVTPVLIGLEDPDTIEKIIEKYYEDKNNGFIISSDLSHFLKNEDAIKIDNYTAGLIEKGITKNFSHELACGTTGILGLIQFANKKNFSMIRINMKNSSSITNDKKSVVGYGAWMLYEGEKNEFIKKYYSDFLIQLCKLSVKSKLEPIKEQISYKKIFDEAGASFVTIEKQGNLRGCIGSIIAHRPLIEDIILNAQNAAFKDPRFYPVKKEELKDLTFAISLLSEPKQIIFEDENDLLEKIVPFKDGIIIKDGNYQAVYLPSVWEQLPDKKEFLNSLKLNAGLNKDYFSKTFEAYRFYTEYIK